MSLKPSTTSKVCASIFFGIFAAVTHGSSPSPEMQLETWSLPIHKSECSYTNKDLHPPEPLGKYPTRITGKDEKRGDTSYAARRLMEYIGHHLDFFISGNTEKTKEFVAELEKNANANAFTYPDFGRRSGDSSPNYIQTLLLINLSYAVAYLDQTQTTYDRKSIVKWGDKILSRLYGKGVTALDSIAARGAARSFWGVTTDRPKILKKGVRDFNRVMRAIRSDGTILNSHVAKYVPEFKNHNIHIQYLALTAELLEMNGISAYSNEYGSNKKTLHDAIQLFTTKFREDSKFLMGEGWLHHYAWAPIYLKRFPDGEVSQIIEVQIASKGDFYGVSIGGNTSCLWGHKITERVKSKLKPEQISDPCQSVTWAKMFPKMCN